jgi:mRNA interferase YafQ
MYLIHYTKDFKKSFSKLKKSGVKAKVIFDLETVIDTISSGRILESSYLDHKLQGTFAGYRECHIRPDLLLVYTIQEKQLVLVLVDIGSHSSIFG